MDNSTIRQRNVNFSLLRIIEMKFCLVFEIILKLILLWVSLLREDLGIVRRLEKVREAAPKLNVNKCYYAFCKKIIFRDDDVYVSVQSTMIEKDHKYSFHFLNSFLSMNFRFLRRVQAWKCTEGCYYNCKLNVWKFSLNILESFPLHRTPIELNSLLYTLS